MHSPLFSFENIIIYQDKFLIEGKVYPFAAVTGIKGGGDKFTINLFPVINSSVLYIKFDSGEEYRVTENAKLLKGKRHKEILLAFDFLRKATFQIRFAKLVNRLKENGSVVLNSIGQKTELLCNSIIKKDGVSVNLKIAKNSGIFEIGTKSDPSCIVVGEKKSGFLQGGGQSISFWPIDEDVDTTQALLKVIVQDSENFC